MKASRSGQLSSFKVDSAKAISLYRCACTASIAILIASSLVQSPALSQTTEFGTTTKSVTLPKGSKVDSRYLLRRKKSPATDLDNASAEEDPEKQAKEDATQLLDAQLLGAWTRVSSVNKGLSDVMIRVAAVRCLQQLTLKPLRFETSAAQELPDIDALFGDLVYYRTEKGLQRLDINSGQIRLISDLTTRNCRTLSLYGP
ncbi:MAG: hypothetical protein GKR97_10960 [Rhizobiaceae bacterium]|nr:hypothetical protein [Rhizobiaceae bacterium]